VRPGDLPARGRAYSLRDTLFSVVRYLESIPPDSLTPHDSRLGFPRITWLPVASENRASSRLRCFRLHQYLDRMGGASQFDLHHDADVLIIQKNLTALALLKAWSFKRQAGKKVFLDIDDVKYVHDSRLRPRISWLMGLADGVWTATPEQAKLVKQFFGNEGEDDDAPIEVLPNCIDYLPLDDDGSERCYPLTDAYDRLEPLRVAWFGGRENIPLDLLRLLARLPGAQVNLISDHVPSKSDPGITFTHWRLDTFAQALRHNHLTVLSHSGDRISESKSANKMVSSIMLGLPVLVSDTPAYRRLAIALGHPEIIFRTESELCDKTSLFSSREAAGRFIADAQAHIMARFGRRIVVERMMELIRATPYRTPANESVSFIWRAMTVDIGSKKLKTRHIPDALRLARSIRATRRALACIGIGILDKLSLSLKREWNGLRKKQGASKDS